MRAILFNSAGSSVGPLARLAGLPLLLRAVLAAQRAGVEEILVLSPDSPKSLLANRHVQVSWRWIALNGADGAPEVLQALRQATRQSGEKFLFMFADSAFEPSALEQLQQAALNGKPVAAAVPQGAAGEWQQSSLFLCHADLFHGLAEGQEGEGLQAFLGRLHGEGQVEVVELPSGLWLRITSQDELRRVYRELLQFRLKPSDGIYARFNKLVVGRPLIRFFLHTPASPNFITAVGLLLALGAAAAFAQGSYAWALLGAALAYIAAMMDHVDGMVARLKFLESNFGVWFETAADMSSYIFVFSGMAWGLYRETGVAHYLVLGALFVLGTVASFVTTSWQRRLASADNPTDYVNRIYARLEQRSDNIFHWFSRKCYFFTRRAVQPYYVILFCLLDWRGLLLAFAALGAQLVWILTLYNNRLFRGFEAAGAAGAGSSSPSAAPAGE